MQQEVLIALSNTIFYQLRHSEKNKFWQNILTRRLSLVDMWVLLVRQCFTVEKLEVFLFGGVPAGLRVVIVRALLGCDRS